jgi:hypothetical protein
MTNNKQQTAVDWLEKEQDNLFISYQKGFMSAGRFVFLQYKLFKQAKEMEKEQIINAFWNGDNTDCTSEQNIKEFAEQYYEQTYGGGE